LDYLSTKVEFLFIYVISYGIQFLTNNKMLDLLGLLSTNLPNNITVSTSPNDKYDYQCNVHKLFSQGKLDQLIETLQQNDSITNIFDFCVESVGNSKFLCFALKHSYMISTLNTIHQNNELMNSNLIEKVAQPKTIIYDYSSPNMSKDMHVGHLRSTIIGDALANVSEFLGHNVIRLNHLGDFGLPFGMILEYVISQSIAIDDKTNLQKIYMASKSLFDSDNDFKNKSYVRTQMLQSKEDTETNVAWECVLAGSLLQYQKIYELLNISPQLQVMGESFYVKYIDDVKKMLEIAGLIELDDKNANCQNGSRVLIKVDGMPNLTYIKSEEKGCAYTYDTTDITALWYRTQIMKADEIYYVVDSRQSLHFEQIFTVGKTMGWLDNKKAVHIAFGTVLDKNGKPLKSRLGDTPKLIDLINESIETTSNEFVKKNKNVSECEYEVNAIAIGSIKHQDYSKCRTSDYKFDSDAMLKFDGNTYTFLSYTVARIRGIFDNVKNNGIDLTQHLVELTELEEIDYKVIRKMLNFSSTIIIAEKTKMLHGFVDNIMKICSSFHSNYTNSRYLNFDGNAKLINYNASKLIMCNILLQILHTSCSLLGLKIVDKM
jgi:arginyl-tRNA synthetase